MPSLPPGEPSPAWLCLPPGPALPCQRMHRPALTLLSLFLTPAKDLAKMHTLFYADGEGLGRGAIDAELERVRRLLPAMRAEAGPLIDLLKEVCVWEGRGCAWPQKGRAHVGGWVGGWVWVWVWVGGCGCGCQA